jgi:large subunit ribosomal protein L19
MEAVKYFHQQVTAKKKLPDFKAGDNVTVHYKIIEGTKERIQDYRGEVVQRKGNGSTQTFTVRKISNGIGVERIFPLYSPNIESIDVNKRGRVRRARLYYLRELTGKKARIKEKRFNPEIETPAVVAAPQMAE